jgi:osmotically-inducible protein OsmY
MLRFARKCSRSSSGTAVSLRLSVRTRVDDGVVTLTGTTNSYAAKLPAGEGAHRVPLVLDVASDIEVRTVGKAARDDTELAQAMRRALEWDALVDDEKIQSTVSNGWVTLGGAVDRLREREDAERAVRHLTGVRGVTNARRLRCIPGLRSAP